MTDGNADPIRLGGCIHGSTQARIQPIPAVPITLGGSRRARDRGGVRSVTVDDAVRGDPHRRAHAEAVAALARQATG